MKNSKVLLLNQGNTPNYGDVAINHTLELFFEQNNIETEFFPFWSEEVVFGKNYNNYSEKTKKILNKSHSILDLFNRLSVNKIVSHIQDYDAIIIGGGELIGSHKGFNSSLKIWSDIAKKYNIPLYILGVSGDLNMSQTMLKRNKESLQKASFICVRDGYSHEIFTNFYKVNNLCMTDVVFAYNKLLKQEISSEPKDDTLLFVPIEFVNNIKKNLKLENEEEYIKYLFNLMNQKLDGIKNVIITTSVLSDDVFAEKFYNYVKENSNINCSLEKYSNINNFLELLKKSKIVVSARMHALILALLNNCKISVIPFKEKLITFEKEYSDSINLQKVENKALDELELVYNLIQKQDYSEESEYIPEFSQNLL